MGISINNNQVMLPDLAAGTDFKWDGAQVTDNNYGTIQDVTYENGSVQVVTDKGTLTFDNISNPTLQEAQEKFAPYDYATASIGDMKGFSWLEIAALVMESEKLRRDSARTANLVARDSAFDSAMASAKSIMDGAKLNLIMGCIGGGVGILGGALSCAGGIKSGVRMAKSNVGTANTKVEIATTQKKLSNTNAEIKTLEAKGNLTPAEQRKLTSLKMDAKKLEAQKAEQLKQLDNDIYKAQEKVDKAQNKVDQTDADIQAKKTEIKELDTKISNEEDPAKKASLIAERKKAVKAQHCLEAKQSRNYEQLKIAQAKADGLKAIRQDAAKFKDDDGSMVQEADAWAAEAKTEHQAAEAKLTAEIQSANTQFQALNGMMQSFASIFQQIGAFLEAKGQAEAKEQDALTAIFQHQEQEEMQVMQNAQKAIDDFKAAWEKYLDSVKQTQDRLVQA